MRFVFLDNMQYKTVEMIEFKKTLRSLRLLLINRLYFRDLAFMKALLSLNFTGLESGGLWNPQTSVAGLIGGNNGAGMPRASTFWPKPVTTALKKSTRGRYCSL